MYVWLINKNSIKYYIFIIIQKTHIRVKIINIICIHIHVYKIFNNKIPVYIKTILL